MNDKLKSIIEEFDEEARKQGMGGLARLFVKNYFIPKLTDYGASQYAEGIDTARHTALHSEITESSRAAGREEAIREAVEAVKQLKINILESAAYSGGDVPKTWIKETRDYNRNMDKAINILLSLQKTSQEENKN